MRAAAQMLGGELEILDFHDCQIFDTYETRVRLAEVIRKFRPRLVFAPYHTNDSYHKDGAAHPDHVATGHHRALRRALRAFRRSEGRHGRALERRAPPVLHGAANPHADPDQRRFRLHGGMGIHCALSQSQMSLRDGKVLESLRTIPGRLRQPARCRLRGGIRPGGAAGFRPVPLHELDEPAREGSRSSRSRNETGSPLSPRQ